MNKLLLLAPVVLALALGLFAVGNTAAEGLTEPKGLITFDMPDGWSNGRFKNGRHFTRAGFTDDPNILGVVPEHRDKYMTIDKMSEGRKRVNETQGHHLVSDRTIKKNGFEIWEGIFEAHVRGQDVVFHTFLMFSGALMIDAHLNASKVDYEEYLPDLQTVVESIRMTEAAKSLDMRGP